MLHNRWSHQRPMFSRWMNWCAIVIFCPNYRVHTINTGGLQRLYCQSMMDGRLFCVVVVTFDLAPFCLQLHRILCFIVAEVLQALAVLAMPLLLLPFQIKMKPWHNSIIHTFLIFLWQELLLNISGSSQWFFFTVSRRPSMFVQITFGLL